ncbi:hypothetical protein TNCV_4742531 [Trichonephila clavipes]|nr:hypothetical protein TNCV_4742531 [Trichonephila clavipes]
MRAIGKGGAAARIFCGLMNLPPPPAKAERIVNKVSLEARNKERSLKERKMDKQNLDEEMNISREILIKSIMKMKDLKSAKRDETKHVAKTMQPQHCSRKSFCFSHFGTVDSDTKEDFGGQPSVFDKDNIAISKQQ